MNNNSIDVQQEKNKPFGKLGLVIKNQREGFGLSKSELAVAIGCGIQTLELWETGSVLPQHSNLIKLAEQFKTSPENLLMGMDGIEPDLKLVDDDYQLPKPLLEEFPELLVTASDNQPEDDRDELTFSFTRTLSKGLVSIDINQCGHYISLNKKAIVALFVGAGSTVEDAAAVGGWE